MSDAAVKLSLGGLASFFVPGRPAPQGSKSIGAHGQMYESSKSVKGWRNTIAVTARAAFAGERFAGPVAVELGFVMPRPVATSKVKPTPAAVKRPDVDKLTRAVLDALSGTAYVDDSQVVELVARKRIAEVDEVPGVWITVWSPAAAVEVDEGWPDDELWRELAGVLDAHPWNADDEGCETCGTLGGPCDVRARLWDAIEDER